MRDDSQESEYSRGVLDRLSLAFATRRGGRSSGALFRRSRTSLAIWRPRLRPASPSSGSQSTSIASLRPLSCGDIPSGRSRLATTSRFLLEFVRGTELRLGIELRFDSRRRGSDRHAARFHDFDYVVGSVHFVGEAAVDHEGWDIWDGSGDADKVWQRYFESLAECAGSGLFDILAHPDLVKVWGRGRPLPDRDPRFSTSPPLRPLPPVGSPWRSRLRVCASRWMELYPAPAFYGDMPEAGAVLRSHPTPTSPSTWGLATTAQWSF